ncbi:MAG: phage tail protein, partial [Rahnella inusitata]
GAKVKIQVDASDMGEVYTTQNKPPFVDAYSKTESNAHYIARDSVKTAGFASGNVANPYMRHEASDAVVYLADRNWSDSRFVYDVQRGSQALENAGWTAQQNWEAPTGCFMTGLNIRPDMGDCRMMGKYYRALMIRTASGSWRQVGN